MKSFVVASGAVACALLSASADQIVAAGLARGGQKAAPNRSQNQIASASSLSKQPHATDLLSASAGPAYPTVRGNNAVLRKGVAYAPSNAPFCVRSAIWAVNTICQKPFLLGGGHRSFSAAGYDCSGTVSFALHYAGVLNSPLVAHDLMHYGVPGRGRWITILANREHTYVVIAGLRLDTTDFRFGAHAGPRWHEYLRLGIGFDVRHPVGL